MDLISSLSLVHNLYCSLSASKINDLNLDNKRLALERMSLSQVWQYGLFYIYFTRQRSHYWVTNFAMYLLLLSILPWLPTLDGKVDEQGEHEHETRKPCECLITILAMLTLHWRVCAIFDWNWKGRKRSHPGCIEQSHQQWMLGIIICFEYETWIIWPLLQHQHTPDYAVFDPCKLITIHRKNCNRAESSIMKK